MATNGEVGKIGVTGASGQLGRRVVELVVEQVGAERVVAITRSPDKLADLAAKGVDVRVGDFVDGDKLANVLGGIDRLLLISVDDISEGARPRLHGNAINAAKRAGVKHLLYSSAIKPQFSPILFLRDHAATEKLIVESGLAYTFLRNNFYFEAVMQSLTQAVASGTVYSATAGGAAAYVSREDCARAAAAVLASDGHVGAIYDITGSYSWTWQEIAGELSTVLGRTINYVPISEEVLRQSLESHGLPPHIAAFVAGIDHGIALGGLDAVSRAVEQLTGSKPETLSAFLVRNRDALTGVAVG